MLKIIEEKRIVKIIKWENEYGKGYYDCSDNVLKKHGEKDTYLSKKKQSLVRVLLENNCKATRKKLISELYPFVASGEAINTRSLEQLVFKTNKDLNGIISYNAGNQRFEIKMSK